MKMTMSEQLEKPSTKRLMTRMDFVGMYRASHSTLMKYIRSGDIELHLVGTTLYVDADEALAALGNPPLRHAVPTIPNDLFSA
jgi:hypothetical protein